MNCPWIVSTDEGTAYCALAQINATEVEELRQVTKIMHSAKINFGRPTVVGTGIPTDAIASRFLGGDSIADLIADYDLSQDQIEIALRYELAKKMGKK